MITLSPIEIYSPILKKPCTYHFAELKKKTICLEDVYLGSQMRAPEN